MMIQKYSGDYYRTLGIPDFSSNETIKKAYKKLALTKHPDILGGTQEAEDLFKSINEAYGILSNDKANFDAFLKEKRNPRPTKDISIPKKDKPWSTRVERDYKKSENLSEIIKSTIVDNQYYIRISSNGGDINLAVKPGWMMYTPLEIQGYGRDSTRDYEGNSKTIYIKDFNGKIWLPGYVNPKVFIQMNGGRLSGELRHAGNITTTKTKIELRIGDPNFNYYGLSKTSRGWWQRILMEVENCPIHSDLPVMSLYLGTRIKKPRDGRFVIEPQNSGSTTHIHSSEGSISIKYKKSWFS